MSIAQQTPFASKAPRRIPSTVRLGPEVVNNLCTRSDIKEAPSDKGQSAAGLLFGAAEQDVLRVEAFKAFPAAASTENGSHKREWLDAVFERSLVTAKTDPELTSLHLVGWYWIRCPDDIAPLFESDIEFHNRRFRRATDVALILRPKQLAGPSIELYSRSSSKPAISKQDYRSGSLLLGNGARVDAPKNVVMRETIDDDYYLRVFQVLDSLDSAEKRERRRKIALRLKTMMPSSFKPAWIRTRFAPAVETTAPESSGLRAKATISMIPPPDPSTSSQVNSRLSLTRSAQTKLRWISSSAVLVVLATGVALTWVYARPLLSALPVNALFHRMGGNTPFDMRVEPQGGGSLLVRWDAHSAAMQSAKHATIQIDDGHEHRSLQLDSSEVATGSILYTPISRDLTFRLEVLDGKGLPTSESMRVVNGSKSALAAHTLPNAQPNAQPGTLAKIPPINTEKPRLRQFDTASHPKATPPAVIEQNPSGAGIRSARNASPPPVNASIPPATKSPLAPVQASARSETTAARLTRTPTQENIEPERKAGAIRNPATIKATESTAGERRSMKTDSSPRGPEPRKTVQDLPPAQSPVSSPQHPVTKNAESTKYVPARPLEQVIPSARDLGSPSGATNVEIEVRINEEGRVIQARVANNRPNNELLTRAAIAAAKEWVFEPAKMYGKSVVSDHTIIFHFQPQVGQQ